MSGLDVGLAGQTVWFGWAMCVGALAMLLYTLVRGFTRRCRTFWAVFVADLFYAALLFGLEFCFLVLLPHNTLRWFYLVGQLIGALLFWCSAAPVCFRFFAALGLALALVVQKARFKLHRRNK